MPYNKFGYYPSYSSETMTITIGYYASATAPDDSYIETEVPMVWEICPTCRGAGTQALHGIALTSEDLADWHEDEFDAYKSGDYDTPCSAGCDHGKIKTPDLSSLTEDERDGLDRVDREMYEMYAMEAAERRAGC